MPTDIATAPSIPPLRAAPLRDGWLVAVLLAVFAVVWLIACAVTSLVPPVDNLEQLTWQHHLAWGYDKHPPLPTWLAWCAVRVFGPTAWATYLLGAALTIASMALFWRLLRDLRGPAYARVGLLAALCVTFYNGRLYYFNHNTLLLLAVVAAAATCWWAFRERSWLAWAFFGIVIGLGALSKYQIAVTVVSAAAFWLSQRGWRDPVHRGGALLAALLALVIFTPHLLWLREHGFAPIDYAMHSSLGVDLSAGDRLRDTLLWIADELLNRALPALVLLGILAVSVGPARFVRCASDSDAARALVLCWGLVPLVFTALLGVVFGVELQFQWGTAFLLFFIPCVMELQGPATWRLPAWHKSVRVFAGIQVVLLAFTVVISPLGFKLKHGHWRWFDARQFAQEIGPAARQVLGGPVRVIIGPQSEGGALALELPGHPLLLLPTQWDRSPWSPRGLIDSCGAVEITGHPADARGWIAVGVRFPGLYWRAILPKRSGSCQVGAS